MNHYGGAQDDDEYKPRGGRRKPTPGELPKFTFTGERIPPIHRSFKRSGCTWVHGIGWVWNPTGGPVD